MYIQPNGAWYKPEIEDVPFISECNVCGGELIEKLIGDGLMTICSDCENVDE